MSEALQRAKGIAEAATPGTRRRDGTIVSSKGTEVDIRIGGDNDYRNWITVKTFKADEDAAFFTTFDRETVSALLDAVEAAREHAQVGCAKPGVSEQWEAIKRVEALLSREEGGS